MSNKHDVQFAQKMLKHHAQAIEMAQKELAQGSDGEMHKLARKMIKAQTKESDVLKMWLNENGQPQTPSKS